MKFSLCLLISLVWIGILCGCGVGKPVLITEEPVLRQVKKQYASPLAYEVRISVAVQEKEAGKGLISTTELGQGVAEALSGSVFKQAYANKQKRRHSFKLGVTDFELKYAGRSGVLASSIATWIITPIGSMFMGDENYTASGQVHATLEENNGEELWSADFDASVECAISDVQRGWNFWDLYFPGPFAAQPNVKKASKHVLPHFYRDVQLKLLEAARDNPIPPPVSDCAIVVGVDKFPDNTTVSVKYTVQDAQAVASLLKERGGDYLAGTFFEFTGQLTAEEVTRQLEHLGERGDLKLRNVFFYYAGVGQVTFKEDTVKHQLLTSTAPLNVRALLQKLSALKCDSCTVILDCGFSGKGGRCVPYRVAVAPEYPETAISSKDVAMLFACGPGQSAYEDDTAKRGIFTDEILQYLQGISDTHKVTSRDIGLRIRYPVSRRARSCGAGRQEPVSNSIDAVVLPARTPKADEAP